MKMLFLTLICTTLFGCGSSPNTNQSATINADTVATINADAMVTIDLRNLKFTKNSVLNLSEIADSVTFVKLSQTVLLSDVRSISIMDETNEILVFSDNLLYRYDKSGNYIGKVFNSGRGPNEAICYMPPIVNSQQKFVTIDDNISNYYKTIDFTGNIISRQDKWTNGVRKTVVGYSDNLEVSYKKNDSYLSSPNSCNIYGDYLVEVNDISTKKNIYNLPNPDKDFRYQSKNTLSSVTLSENFLYFNKTTNYCYFSIANADTIYRTTNFMDVEAKFSIKLSEPRHTVKSYMMQYNGAHDKSRSGYLISGRRLFSDRYFFFNFYKTPDIATICYDNALNTTIEFDKIKDDVGGSGIEIPVRVHQLFSYNNKLYHPIDALTILDSGNASKFKGLTEDSNPMIMVIHLKK